MKSHSTSKGAANAAASVPGSALIWATWQQIGHASTDPGLSTCHQAAPVARSTIPAKAAIRAAMRSAIGMMEPYEPVSYQRSIIVTAKPSRATLS